MNQITTYKRADRDWSWPYRMGGAAALLAGVALLIAMFSLIVASLQPGTPSGWTDWFESLWLITIFKLHAGSRGVQPGLLTGLNPIDLVFLAVVGVMHLGLYAVLRKTSRVWSIVAAVQPWLGMVLFLVTSSAGRSAVMGAALVASFLTLGSAVFKKITAYIGILGSALLLAGDFSVGVIPPSAFVAALFGIGYVLLMIWFFLVGETLVGLGSGTPRSGS
jgi:hypothetical protein